MDFSRKIFIIFIIIIFTYILIRLFQKRSHIKNLLDTNTIEGYENSKVNTIVTANKCPINIQDNLQARLNNINTITGVNKTAANYLCNYAIKASMNSAYNGSECNTDMLNYVLTRGCRFIDLAVFRDPVSGASIVSVSTGKDYTYPITQEKPLLLSDALEYINMYAFNSTCPNPGDPIFIQFRPRQPSSDDMISNIYLKQIYTDIYNGCNTYLKQFAYTSPVTQNTDINSLLGKIVLVMDTTLYNYSNVYPELKPIINMDNNTSSTNTGMNTISYGNLPPQSQLVLSPDKFTCNINTVTQNLWIDSKNIDYASHSNSYLMFQNYSCQIVPMQFYNNGTDLYNYEMLFNNCGGGIVPLSLVYSKVNINTNPYIAYPDPIFTIPNYGNQTTSIIVITVCLGIAGYIIYNEIK
jgi:hypothetical protein